LFPSIVAELQKLKTWDQIYVYGQASYKGDIRHIQIGDTFIFRDEFESGWKIEVQWSRDDSNGLLRALLGLELGIMVFPDGRRESVNVNDSIFFHIVGQPEPTSIPFKMIESIIVG
jgi:hypothetical protein